VDTNTGEEIKFQSKDFPELLEANAEIKDQIYKRICEATILQYKKGSTIDSDDLIIDQQVIGD
jgi:hypothetical protein